MQNVAKATWVLASAATFFVNISVAQDLVAHHQLVDTLPAHFGVELVYQVSITNNGSNELRSIKLALAPSPSLVPLVKRDLMIGQISAGQTVDVKWVVTIGEEDSKKGATPSFSFVGNGVSKDGRPQKIALTSVGSPK